MTNWRDDYFHWCGRHGFPVDAAHKVLRQANTVKRAAEVACLSAAEADYATWSAKDDDARARIRSIVAEVNGGRIGEPDHFFAEFSGDPRGPTTRIIFGRGPTARVCAVPANGLTAFGMKCIERRAGVLAS